MSTIGVAAPQRAPRRAPVPADRWERRPRLAFLVRFVVFLAPAVVATDVSLVLTRLLPRPEGVGESFLWWVAVLGVSGVTLLVFDRLFRRLLPLTALLNLALVFPGVAPSRFSAAFRAGSVRNLQRRIEQAKEDAASADTVQAASTVVELVGALAIHDPRTRGHSERTRAYADLIAEELGLSSEERDHLRWAALLHDIGKLHVRATVLNKPGRPNPDEWEVLKSHPVEGARIAGALRHWLGPWGLAIEQHHERFDGTGYPQGLAGADISLAGRIVAVADAYEVMTSARTYTPPVAPADAREELVACAGGHFDPEIVHAFLRIAVGRFPRRAGFLVVLAQVPGFFGVQQLLQQAGTVVAAGTAVASLAVGGVVIPGSPGLGGLEDLDFGRGPLPTRPLAGGVPGSTTTSTVVDDLAALPPADAATSVPGASTSTSTVTTVATAPTVTTVLGRLPSTTTSSSVRGTSTTTTTDGRTIAPGYFLAGTAPGDPASPAALLGTSPTDATLDDYDDDGEPGRTVASSSRPATTAVPAEHQQWFVRPGEAATITGTPTLEISSALAGFQAGRGSLQALLLDCDGEGKTCLPTPITTASAEAADWSAGAPGFTSRTLTFDPTDHALAAGRTLVLRLVVPTPSEPVLLAYGAQDHPAYLTVAVTRA